MFFYKNLINPDLNLDHHLNIDYNFNQISIYQVSFHIYKNYLYYKIYFISIFQYQILIIIIIFKKL